ncbi:hypothetical protein HK102_005368 [Quaeritorhiza haematococci]|nr:hypothetical protein HK102_005368 [Quaeritorhiza haematococci]
MDGSKKNQRSPEEEAALIRDLIVPYSDVIPVAVQNWIWPFQRDQYKENRGPSSSPTSQIGVANFEGWPSLGAFPANLTAVASANGKNGTQTGGGDDASKQQQAVRSIAQFAVLKVAGGSAQKRVVVQRYRPRPNALAVQIAPPPERRRSWFARLFGGGNENKVGDDSAGNSGKFSRHQIVDPNIRERLLDIKSINHNNIARFQHLAIQERPGNPQQQQPSDAFDPPLCSFVYDVCGKGTLEDVLMAQRVTLHPRICFNLAMGLVCGMRYLHEQTTIGSHGFLNGRTCLIDDSWTLKICGFGITDMVLDNPGFAQLNQQAAQAKKDALTEKLFVAPELLRAYPKIGSGTPVGDVYSAAMVMYMIFLQRSPFEGYTNIQSLIDNIPNDNQAKIRPMLPSDMNKDHQQLLTQCWTFDPSARPTFTAILSHLKGTDPYDMSRKSDGTTSASPALMSALFTSDLQSYIHDLEVQVANSTKTLNSTLAGTNKKLEAATKQFQAKTEEFKTQLKQREAREKNLQQQIQLRDEQMAKQKAAFMQEQSKLKNQMEQKTAELRYSLLPPALVSQAQQAGNKQGAKSVRFAASTPSLNTPEAASALNPESQIEPKMYEGATVLVVSIAGFTRYSEQLQNSAPWKLIELLKGYHGAIDAIVAKYPKVYVVDRICDVCIMVSGAPQRHERHAEDIAEVALKIKNWASIWDCAWILDSQNRVPLHFGIHSGPVVAGVFGKIPKIVLMGETVNLASRIQGLSSNQEIRVSSVTQAILAQRGYTFEAKESLDLKHRGFLGMHTLLNGPPTTQAKPTTKAQDSLAEEVGGVGDGVEEGTLLGALTYHLLSTKIEEDGKQFHGALRRMSDSLESVLPVTSDSKKSLVTALQKERASSPASTFLQHLPRPKPTDVETQKEKWNRMVRSGYVWLTED